MKMCDNDRTVVHNETTRDASQETSMLLQGGEGSSAYQHKTFPGLQVNDPGDSSDVLSFSSSEAQFQSSSSVVVSEEGFPKSSNINDENDENDSTELRGMSQLDLPVAQQRVEVVINKPSGKTKSKKKEKRDDVKKQKTVKKVKNTVTKKKKESSNKVKNQKAKNSSGSQKKSTKSEAGQKRKTKSNSTKAANKKQKEDVVEKPEVPDDVYEKHLREFERVVIRLEKEDKYAFFLMNVPPEFDEDYEKRDSSNATDSDSSTGMADGDVAGCAKNNGTTEECLASRMTDSRPTSPANTANDDDITFPTTPPYNFEIIRRRMKYGRYVLDREEKAIQDQCRLAELLPSNDGKCATKEKRIVLHKKGVNWDVFKQDIIAMCDAAVERNPSLGNDCSPGTLSHAAKKIKSTMEQLYERIGSRQIEEMYLAEDHRFFAGKIETTENEEAAMQGKWRRDAFPARKYERLSTDVVCAGLSELDERIASFELQTSLPDKFIGLSYIYDDTGQSEDWMKAVVNETEAQKNEERKAALELAADDGVIRAQVATAMSSLLTAVQDRVMTEQGVLHERELRSANCIPTDINEYEGEQEAGDSEQISSNATLMPEIAELPVWGIDCYTRQNITLCLTDFDSDTVLVFIEKWLLPAINACPVDLAHNISNAALILEGLPSELGLDFDDGVCKFFDEASYKVWSHSLLGKSLLNKIKAAAPPWLKTASQLLRRAHYSLGADFFRVHPKGQGSVVLSPVLEANTLVTFYCGEVYPSWRWGEKMDAIEITQQSKALKPALPDFYNMALERPQSDPRRYGLLFVDASRKAGHGSFLSHSCEPTCEVRVAALNGKLCLAMTTLRRVEAGEELTFDYNAVTESLNEYRSAVCLCGYGKCRGSFLHFAMAECYQQVLNRNSPIAIRFANLAKGCMKKVMAQDDESVLQNHGFFTAIFGAISMNNHLHASGVDEKCIIQDSMEIVPVWLRTFVADTLRYIEYERRALPISLICDHMKSFEEEKGQTTKKTKKQGTKGKNKKRDNAQSESSSESDEESKPINRSSPESPFSFFLRVRKHFLYSLLLEKGFPKTISGKELETAIEKVASSHWQALSATEQNYWKEQADEEWEKDGAREKSRKSKEPKQLKDQSKSKKGDSKGKKQKLTEDENDDEDNEDESSAPVKISFQAADAEGVSAMEQRIQQLAQTLSRVGRVLYRHRESSLESQNFATVATDTLREVVQSPLTVASDGQVVAWMWNHEDGVVQSLLASLEIAQCASPSMHEKVKAVAEKYKVLEKFGHPLSYSTKRAKLPMMPAEGKRRLKAALLEFRAVLLTELDAMAKEWKKYKISIENEALENNASSDDGMNVESEDEAVLPKNADISASRVSSSASDGSFVSPETVSVTSAKDPCRERIRTSQEDSDDDATPSDEQASHWLDHYNERFKIQAAADLLLLYANTCTFFLMQPYQPLESAPIEVYARELGNAVPRAAIDSTSTGVKNRGKLPKTAGICNPEDIVSKVTVKYQGDYVLSQLLQWYNGGIGQKPGLPDLIGCVLLPFMAGCWKDNGKLLKPDRPTFYERRIRPMLSSWLRDPHQRGSPFPKEIKRAFTGNDTGEILTDTSSMWLPFGSPILDLLVSGDDTNLQIVLRELGGKHAKRDPNGGPKSTADSLLTATVDQGRPAQAVCNWVQCENPECQKWRKIPWHVDIDVLSKNFVCSDNRWNFSANSCDAPEDTWDEEDDVICGWKPDTPKKSLSSPKRSKSKSPERLADNDKGQPSTADEVTFNRGDRFDVLRSLKTEFCVGIVVDVDPDANKVKFSFPKKKSKYDEWIQIGSRRIASLGSKTKGQKKGTKAAADISRSDRFPRKRRIIDTDSTDDEMREVPQVRHNHSQKQDACVADSERIPHKRKPMQDQGQAGKQNNSIDLKKSEEDKILGKRGRIPLKSTRSDNEKSFNKKRALMPPEPTCKEDKAELSFTQELDPKDISRIDHKSNSGRTEPIPGSQAGHSRAVIATTKLSEKEGAAAGKDEIRIPRRYSPARSQEQSSSSTCDNKIGSQESPSKKLSMVGRIPRRKASSPGANSESPDSVLKKPKSFRAIMSSMVANDKNEPKAFQSTPPSRKTDITPPRQDQPASKPSPTSFADAAVNSSHQVHSPRKLQFGEDIKMNGTKTQTFSSDNFCDTSRLERICGANDGLDPVRDCEKKDALEEEEGSMQDEEGYHSPGEIEDGEIKSRSPGEIDDVAGRGGKGEWRDDGYGQRGCGYVRRRINVPAETLDRSSRGRTNSFDDEGYHGRRANVDGRKEVLHDFGDMDKKGRLMSYTDAVRGSGNHGESEEDWNRHTRSNEQCHGNGQGSYRGGNGAYRDGFSNDRYGSPRNDRYGSPQNDLDGSPRNDRYGSPRNDRYGSPRNDRYRSPSHDRYGSPRNDRYGSPRNDRYGSPRNDRHGSPRSDRHGSPRNDRHGSPRNDRHGSPRNDRHGSPRSDRRGSPHIDRGSRSDSYGCDSGGRCVGRDSSGCRGRFNSRSPHRDREGRFSRHGNDARTSDSWNESIERSPRSNGGCHADRDARYEQSWNRIGDNRERWEDKDEFIDAYRSMDSREADHRGIDSREYDRGHFGRSRNRDVNQRADSSELFGSWKDGESIWKGDQYSEGHSTAERSVVRRRGDRVRSEDRHRGRCDGDRGRRTGCYDKDRRTDNSHGGSRHQRYERDGVNYKRDQGFYDSTRGKGVSGDKWKSFDDESDGRCQWRR